MTIYGIVTSSLSVAGSVVSVCPTVVAGLLLARRLQGGGCHSVTAVTGSLLNCVLSMWRVHRSLYTVDEGKGLKRRNRDEKRAIKQARNVINSYTPPVPGK